MITRSYFVPSSLEKAAIEFKTVLLRHMADPTSKSRSGTQNSIRLSTWLPVHLLLGVAALCCLSFPAHGQSNIQVTVKWSQLTGISSTDTSFGLNAQTTDPNIVSIPGNSTYKTELGNIGSPFLRIWGGQWGDAKYSGGWLHHMGQPDERWAPDAIKKTLTGYAPYGPKHVLVTIGGWPDYMNDPATNQLLPSYYAAFAAFCADLVRIANKENPGGRHVDMFEMMNEAEDSYQNPGDGLILGKIVSQAAIAMKAVDPTIKVAGNAFAWAVNGEMENYLLAIKAAGDPIDFVSWHEYPTGDPTTPTRAIWKNGNQGQADPTALAMESLIVQTLGHPLPMYVDEYAINWEAWGPPPVAPDPRVRTAVEAVYDALMSVSYLRAGAGSAKWNESDDTYGVLSAEDTNFKYRPTGYLFTLLNHGFIGPEALTTTSDGARVVPFAVRQDYVQGQEAANVVGSLLLIHSVKKEQDVVQLNMSDWLEIPKEIIVNTITNSGLSTTTLPFSSDLTLTLPPTSVTFLTFQRREQ